jgi:hypothetical protein
MKKYLLTLAVAALIASLFTSCSSNDDTVVKEGEQIAQDVLAQIKSLGFSTENVIKEDGGYIVEGDIFLSEEALHQDPLVELMRFVGEEQYRTFNLVGGLPRTLRIAMTTNLPSSYSTALNTAISRFNNENLRLKFLRVSQYPVDILFDRAPNGATYLASAGFPSGGNPHGSVLMNVNALGNNPNSSYLATIMAHEMGHCIGFRHTDYMNRSYSCGSGGNEGQATTGIGAVHIPGTPTGPDPNSWMLACIGNGVNRPFNTNDKTALRNLYQ